MERKESNQTNIVIWSAKNNFDAIQNITYAFS